MATTSAHKMLSPHSRPVDFLMLVQSRLPTYLKPERLKMGRNTHGKAPCFHWSTVDRSPKAMPNSTCMMTNMMRLTPGITNRMSQYHGRPMAFNHVQ